ncbi:N-acetylneuraminate synthase family protein [Candidatus Pelagibacter sp.]|nr:N-acetylneuraminate synthase family protein [Candidatus Pelagibacter sp.]
MKLKKPYLIAEIGINHNGSIKLAKKLIDLAAKYKFDAVKFQKRTPEIATPEDQKNKLRQTPWGEMTYFKYKKKIEFGLKEFREIDKYCKIKKIEWFVSCWDNPSIDFIKKFKTPYNKVASAMLTNTNFLENLAKEKKKTLISTGMSTIKDINKAVDIFKRNKCPYVIMHCVSQYPCPEEKLNLNLIKFYKKKFNCEVGYSGHESTVSPSLLAWFLGANYIERHITLDRAMWGTDQSASLSEDGMRSLASIIEKSPKILGNGIKKISKEDLELREKFKYW